jgi:hypothetical protein
MDTTVSGIGAVVVRNHHTFESGGLAGTGSIPIGAGGRENKLRIARPADVGGSSWTR